MFQRVFIHKATRVIRRVSSRTTHQGGVDEEYVDLDVAVPIDLGKGYLKLDPTNVVVSADLSEARQAGLDEEWEHQQRVLRRAELKSALDDIVTDGAIPIKIRRVFSAFHSLLAFRK